MDVSLFDFDLPDSCIAERPARPRDSARLLEVPPAGPVVDHENFCAFPSLLGKGDLVVFNDTRVIPARLYGYRNAVEVEILLCHEEAPMTWMALARPGKRLKVGQKVVFSEDPVFSCEIHEKRPGGEVVVHFPFDRDTFSERLFAIGSMPLPPYILKKRQADEKDRSDYQTRFAAREGAVAAPTAGLHFTDRIMADIETCGIQTVALTLHVGGGTFLPVRTENVLEHEMHAETGELSEAAAEKINATRKAGGRIIAVGTTALRLLETAGKPDGTVTPFSGETNIFILPGTPIKIADGLVTNFHLPRSTLFMLVSAFSGRERMLKAYIHARDRGYRFYSYGDACFLHR